jgi:hypothetical protein
MIYLYKNAYEGYMSLNGKTMAEYIEKNWLFCRYNRISYNHLFYCSKTYVDFCQNINEDEYNEIVEKIMKYPIIIDYIKDILQEDFILSKYVKREKKKPEIETSVNELENTKQESVNLVSREKDELDFVLDSICGEVHNV